MCIRDSITGLPSGYDEFDEKTAGLQNGELIIIAGRPSMGKTSFAMNIVEYAALRSEASVAIFSMDAGSIINHANALFHGPH